MAQIPGKHNVEKVSFYQSQQQFSGQTRRSGGSGGQGSATFLVGAALAVVRARLVDRALADPADSKARLAVGVKPEEEIHYRYTLFTHRCVCQACRETSPSPDKVDLMSTDCGGDDGMDGHACFHVLEGFLTLLS